MTNKKDKEKHIQEKLQIILSDLLKDDDNKYCVDCDAKGPRWASWSLGIFLCIRCAGIHRNLGVHISRVKSVNLDSWNPQQVAMMKEIGNSRGRAIYEANLDDTFRRPQIDSVLEKFIRDKYEHKRYIAKEWVPPKPNDDLIAEEIRKIDQNQHKKQRSTINLGNSTGADYQQKPIERPKVEQAKPLPDNQGDLLGLSIDNQPSDAITKPSVTEQDSNQFGDFVFASVPNTTINTDSTSSAIDDLMGLNLGGGSTVAPNGQTNFSCIPNSTNGTTTNMFDKNSILALYSTNNSMSAQCQAQHQAVNSSMPNPGAFGAQHNPFLANSDTSFNSNFNMFQSASANTVAPNQSMSQQPPSSSSNQMNPANSSTTFHQNNSLFW